MRAHRGLVPDCIFSYLLSWKLLPTQLRSVLTNILNKQLVILDLSTGCSHHWSQSLGVGPLTERVTNEKDQKVLRFVGRTNANIILTLSRPIKWEFPRVTFLKFSPFQSSTRQAKRKSNRTTSNVAFILVLSLLRLKSTFFWKGVGSLHAGKTSSWKAMESL